MAIPAKNLVFEIYEGASFEASFQWLDGDGVAVDLTGAVITFEVLERVTDGAAKLSVSTADDITVTDAAGGLFEIAVAGADTVDLGFQLGQFFLHVLQGGVRTMLATGRAVYNARGTAV